MKKKITLLLLSAIAISTLAGCSSETSSSTSGTQDSTNSSDSTQSPDSSSPASSSVVDDVQDDVVVTRRDGEFSLLLALGDSTWNMPLMSYSSPLSYIHGDDGESDDYEIKLSPTEVYSEDGGRDLSTISDNYSGIACIFGIADMIGDLPLFSLASAAYDDLSDSLDASELSEEYLTIDIVDSVLSFSNTSVSDGETRLRNHIYSGSSLDLDIDLSSLITSLVPILSSATEDLVSLLAMLDALFPDESITRPILSLLADIFYVIGKGLAIDIVTDDDSAEVTFYLNEEGKELVGEYLSDLIGNNIGIGVSDLSLYLRIENTAEANNLLTDLDIGADVIVDNMPFTFDASIDLDTAAEEIDSDYFVDVASSLSDYASLADEAEEFYSPISSYVDVPINSIASMIGQLFGSSDESISLSTASGELLSARAQEYDGLSDEIKFILGDHVDSQSIKATYDEGITLVQNAISSYEESSEKPISSSEFYSLLRNIISYADWQEAMTANGGEDVLAALDQVLTGELADAKEYYEAFITALEDDDEAGIRQAVSESVPSLFADMFVDQWSEGYQEVTALASTLSSLKDSYIISKFNSTILDAESIDDLISLKDDGYCGLTVDSFSSGITTASYNHVEDLLSSQAEELKSSLLEAFTSDGFDEYYTTYEETSETISQLEEFYLGTTSIYDGLVDFADILNGAISAQD